MGSLALLSFSSAIKMANASSDDRMRAKATVEELAAYDLKRSMADDAKSIDDLYGIRLDGQRGHV